MDDVIPWILAALIMIGFFTCVRWVWYLLARLFQRKSREQRLIEELLRYNQQAQLTYLTALLHETDAPVDGRGALGRLAAGRDGHDRAAAPIEDTRRS